MINFRHRVTGVIRDNEGRPLFDVIVYGRKMRDLTQIYLDGPVPWGKGSQPFVQAVIRVGLNPNNVNVSPFDLREGGGYGT